MNNSYPRLASRVFNTPLLITPEAAANVANVLGERMGLEPIVIEARGDLAELARSNQASDELYTVDSDGIATIAVHGELVNRGSWMDAMSGVTSYKSLLISLDAAAADNRVRGIVLDIDSPGGEAAGAMEAAAHIRAVSAKKRVVAYVDSLAASAAYALASGAAEIVATPSATLGSIGVVYMHLDRSQAVKDKGFKPTFLHAGAFKIDGNSMQPLPDDARARIQDQIDQVYALFLDTIGQLRPALGRDGARKTEAGKFFGQRAVEAGLADRIGGLDALKTAFPRNTSFEIRSKTTMSDELMHTQAALETAVSAAVENIRRDADAASLVTAESARLASRTEERERIRSILDSEPAKGRMNLARHLALSSDMSLAAASSVLFAAAPEANIAAIFDARVPRLDLAANTEVTAPANSFDAGRMAFAAAAGKRTAA